MCSSDQKESWQQREKKKEKEGEGEEAAHTNRGKERLIGIVSIWVIGINCVNATKHK